mmetsp:Transcript_30645/g.81977  ORF Transcript_30645/g.81977 Transcript_30645/m.81977 type:complete len:162 (-) Transcript_30645:690-1175(-)
MDEETGLAIKDHRGPSASVNDSPFGEMCGARGRRRARRGFWVAAAAAGLLLVLWAAIPRRRHSEEMPVVDAGLAGSDNGLATQQYSLALVPTDVALARQQKLSKTCVTLFYLFVFFFCLQFPVHFLEWSARVLIVFFPAAKPLLFRALIMHPWAYALPSAK